MRGSVVAGVLSAGLLAGGASAQDAVQWRVEDGGNGHWYRLSTEAADWVAASTQSVLLGGHLATLTSAPEATFLQQFAPAVKQPFFGVWAGGFQSGTPCGPNCGWTWVTGEPWNFANWGAGEPNDYGGSESILEVVLQVNGYWNDNDSEPQTADGARQYLIEWSADCNNDGIVDYGQILAGELEDLDANGVPDCCDAGTSCEACSADIDGNGAVDAIDLAIAIGYWGTDGGKDYPQADLDGSGTIDGADLATLLGSWGPCE